LCDLVQPLNKKWCCRSRLRVADESPHSWTLRIDDAKSAHALRRLCVNLPSVTIELRVRGDTVYMWCERRLDVPLGTLVERMPHDVRRPWDVDTTLPSRKAVINTYPHLDALNGAFGCGTLHVSGSGNLRYDRVSPLMALWHMRGGGGETRDPTCDGERYIGKLSHGPDHKGSWSLGFKCPLDQVARYSDSATVTVFQCNDGTLLQVETSHLEGRMSVVVQCASITCSVLGELQNESDESGSNDSGSGDDASPWGLGGLQRATRARIMAMASCDSNNENGESDNDCHYNGF